MGAKGTKAVNNPHIQHVWLTCYIAHWDPCSSNDRQLTSFYRRIVHHNAIILRFTLRSTRFTEHPCMDEGKGSEVKQRFGDSDGELLRAETEQHGVPLLRERGD